MGDALAYGPSVPTAFFGLCWRGLKTRTISWVVVKAVQTLTAEWTKFGLELSLLP